MPEAVWQGEHSPRRTMSRYDIVCVHTIVGYAPAHAAHFSVKADGTILQSRDTKYRSAANLEGNHRIIAIENEDHGGAFGAWNTRDGHAVPGFTAAQREANAKIIAWAHKVHGIPITACPNSRSSSRGVAYHRQGVPGNFSDYAYGGKVSGGETWTTAPGKVCPGDERIAETLRVIIPRALEIAGGDMPSVGEIWYDRTYDYVNDEGDETSARHQLARSHQYSYVLFQDNGRHIWKYRGYDQFAEGDDRPTTKDWQISRAHQFSYEVRNEGRDRGKTLRRMERKQDAILDALEGVDQQAILERIDQRTEEDSERISQLESALEDAGRERAELRERINEVHDVVGRLETGELDAEQVVRMIGELLAPAGDNDADLSEGDVG